jgi:hypothetical protein
MAGRASNRGAQEESMTAFARMTVHFMDGTKMAVRYPKQAGTDPATIVSTVKRAIDADKLVLEIDNDLLVIPIRNIKYVQVSPAPSHLPPSVLRQARVID